MTKRASQEELGAQYRDAKTAIVAHRRRQAAAEQAHVRVLRDRRSTPDDIDEARAAVTQAHHDVQWCVACTVAAGEAYKGVTIEEAIATGLADRSNLPAHEEGT